ncbi:hypothetical protein ACIPL1_28545 [Pseudomonas sp. NPDC090202]|uniref:hypothetical protein n=1 Tax=unclassified Pseudomonas TaxID=196821 RepID=UPI0038247E2A
MSEDTTPLAVNRLGKDAPVVDVQRSALRCYFRPETEEFVFLAGKEAGEFETHWRGMADGMDKFHQAQANYSSALKHYDECAKAAVSSRQMEKSLTAIDSAETELEKAREEIKEKLAGSASGFGYDNVVELIPMVAQVGARRMPYAYVKQSYFTEAESKRRLHNVSLRPGGGKGGGRSGQNSFLSRDESGKLLVSTSKLTEQLTALEWPKIKLELKDILDWTGSDFDPEDLKIDATLFEWAVSWNDSLLGKKKLTDNVDVSGAAQFMRFTANLGANAEFDVEKGAAAFKGEAQATLTLASGYADIKGYVPDRFGWPLTLQARSGKTMDLGLLRICLAGETSGFLGASLQLEAQLQVMVKGDEQIITGQSGAKPRFRTRKDKGRDFFQAMEAQDQGTTITAGGFAGAKVEILGKSTLQWLKPAPPPDSPDAAPSNRHPDAGGYVDFATIGSSIAGMAGIGAGGKFFCTFLNGKFCLHVAASLCVGVGAKGGFIAEVGAKDIIEFGRWIIYQLYLNNYGILEYVNEDAFRTYYQYCALKVIAGKEIAYQGAEWAMDAPKDVARMLKALIDDLENKKTNGTNGSEARNQIANVIIEQKQDLLTYTPETKGIFLYLLTRHGMIDHIDLANRSWVGDIYHRRKEAIILILNSIQTQSEWRKVMCRMTVDGSKLPGNSEKVSEDQKEHLIRFLQEGRNRDVELRDIRNGLANIYNGLKIEPALGYALSMNNTYYYQLNCDANPHYPVRCDFGDLAESSNKIV